MKYYSEQLKKYYDTEAECLEAEKEFKEKYDVELKKREERAAEAKQVEQAYKDAEAARSKADKMLNEFIKKYGSYHTTRTEVVPVGSIFDFFFK